MGLGGSDGDKHRYQLCQDEECPRSWCRIYKEGFRNGYEAGYERGYTAGYADGYQAGYKQGFPDGIAACPRPHR
jgi:flagellar biosynthesis/type III secretory pathway protein FliH